MRARAYLWCMVSVLLVATLLRFVAFGQVPPGLYHDEAYHGLDAVDILPGRHPHGYLPLYFPANNGREPLFIYLVALAVGLLGKSPFALRLVASFAGLVTVAAAAAMARTLFSRRVGFLTAAVLAVTLWHVHLSRVGFRAVLLPLFIALTVWQVARGFKTGGRYHWLAAGLLYGLSFYTYMAARFTPVALAAFGLYVLATQPSLRNRRAPIVKGSEAAPISNPQLWRRVGLAALTALVTLAPLAAYAMVHPDVVLGRPGQVSVFNPTINGGDLWGTLGAHALNTLGMFFVRGDRIWRHNVPWRPVFDPVLGLAFVLGFVVALCRARREPAAGFALIWTAVMSLPTFLAEDAPHFLRAVGVLPILACLPALGLDWLAARLSLLSPRQMKPRDSHCSLIIGHWFLLILSLLFGLTSTAWAYFGDYAGDPMTGYWFERGATALAGRVNRFLGLGWDGERMLHADAPADRRIYLDPALWEEWPQARFLVAAPEAVTVGFDGQPSAGPTAIFVWPYGDWRQELRLQTLLPAPAEISVEEGPRSQGDLDPEPYVTYLAFFATRPDPGTPALARFSGGVEWLGMAVTPMADGRLRVRLRWRAGEPLAESHTVFLHYLRDGERIAQADSPPAGGRYPTTAWRPGDVINDDHYLEGVDAPLPGHDVVRFGLWQPESGAALYLLDDAGNPVGDWIEVPVDGG